MRSTIDKAGRLVIPKPLRDQLGLRPGEVELTADGFRAYRHRLVPPNDGGLSLGQVAVAAAWLSAGTAA